VAGAIELRLVSFNATVSVRIRAAHARPRGAKISFGLGTQRSFIRYSFDFFESSKAPVVHRTLIADSARMAACIVRKHGADARAMGVPDGCAKPQERLR
jgi:hypothetical protein